MISVRKISAKSHGNFVFSQKSILTSLELLLLHRFELWQNSKNSQLKYYKSSIFSSRCFQGSNATIVARGYDEVHEFEVEELKVKNLPHGIGNFFIGGKQCIFKLNYFLLKILYIRYEFKTFSGFLSQLAQGHGLERCVEGGHFAARQLILHGPRLDGECPFEWWERSQRALECPVSDLEWP